MTKGLANALFQGLTPVNLGPVSFEGSIEFCFEIPRRPPANQDFVEGDVRWQLLFNPVVEQGQVLSLGIGERLF